MNLIFKNKKHEVGSVWSYFFESNESLEFEAGQYINLTMPDVPPAVADRIFTIASAPCEESIQFTTLLGESLFKEKLNSLKFGDVITADQLGGDFTYELSSYQASKLPSSLQNDIRRLFIAGGIGVTPFISIIRDRLQRNIPINATLLYAGKDDRRPFIEKLESAAASDNSLVIRDYVSTRLNLEILKRDFPDIQKYLVYLAGSQEFAESLGEGLIGSGFPSSQIKYDYFDGYTSLEY